MTGKPEKKPEKKKLKINRNDKRRITEKMKGNTKEDLC